MVPSVTASAESTESTESSESHKIQHLPKRRRHSPSTGWRSLLIKRRATIPGFSRHSRKCKICHNHRAPEIEECYVNWTSAHWIQDAFRIKSPDAIYRHARAAGLDVVRRHNARFAAEKLVEEVDHVTVTSATVLRAIRALSCLDDKGHWTDPPSTHIILTAKDLPARSTSSTARFHSSEREPEVSLSNVEPQASSVQPPEPNRVGYEKLEIDVTCRNEKEDAPSNR